MTSAEMASLLVDEEVEKEEDSLLSSGRSNSRSFISSKEASFAIREGNSLAETEKGESEGIHDD